MKSFGRSDRPPPFVAEERAEPEQLVSLRYRLGQWLKDSDCGAERAQRLLLAANEAVTNAVEHAYAGTQPGPVLVRGEVLADDTIRITVSDRGSWRPAHRTEYRGRGIFMMQECGDTVRIEKTHHGTEVSITSRPQPYPEPGPGLSFCREYFQVSTATHDDHVAATVTGTLPAECETALSRELLAASCGGVIPLTIDITGLTEVTDNARRAIEQTVRAAHRVGGSTTLVVDHPHTEAWTDIAELSEITYPAN